MSKKKHPNPPVKLVQENPPVRMGNVFATFLREAQSIGNEVEARRALQNEVAAFLNEKGLADEFEAWRAARAKPPKTS